jgi:hypothetical protein
VVLATSALLKLSLPTTGKLVVMLIVGLLVLYLWNRACDLPRKMFWTSEDDGRGRRYYPLILTRKPNGRNDLWKYSYLSLDEHEAAALDREQAEKALWPSLKRLING